MHLSFLTPEYPHPKVSNAAGIATSIKNLADGLVTKGITVSIFIYHQSEDIIFEEKGIRFHLIKHRKYKILGWLLYRKYIESYVNRVILEDGIDAIEAPDWTGITAFMKFHVPLIIRFHGSDTYFCHLEGRKQKWKNRLFEKNAVQKAVSFIAPTTYAGAKSAELFKLDPSKVTTIHYGINLAHFENNTPLNYTLYRILNIGTVIRKKGVFELAEVFNAIIEKYDQAELLFIGGDAPDLLSGCSSTWKLVEKSLSEKAKQRCHYLGKIPYEKVKEHMKDAHVCAFPSLAETLGMVTIESMALQKAVVNTNYGWAQELIDHKENGYLIDPKDIKLYVDTISQLFDNSELVSEIGRKARMKIGKTFAIEDIVEKNINYYKKLLSK